MLYKDVHKSLPCTGKAHNDLKLHFKIPTKGKNTCSNFTSESYPTYITLFVKVSICRKPTAPSGLELSLAIHLWQLDQQNPCKTLKHRK